MVIDENEIQDNLEEEDNKDLDSTGLDGELLDDLGDDDLSSQIGLGDLKELKKENKKYKKLIDVLIVIGIILLIPLLWFTGNYYYYSLIIPSEQSNNKSSLIPKETKEKINTTYQNNFEIIKNYIDNSLLGPLGNSLGLSLGNGIGNKNNSKKLTKLNNWPKKIDISKKGQQTSEIFKEKYLSNFLEYTKDTSYSYIEKENKIKDYLKNGISKINSNKANIEDIESNIFQYAFIPKEMDQVLMDNQIQEALLAIESVKFFTALKVYKDYFNINQNKFDEMANFIKNNMSNPPTNLEIQNHLEYFIDRGDQDIKKYLVNCYLDPLSGNEECRLNGTNINDFENHYYYEGLIDQFNTKVFTNIMYKLIDELDGQNFPPPPINIILNDLNPFEGEIAFSVDINTLDERGVNASHHRNLITTFINSLRESQAIISQDVKLNSIETNKQQREKAGQQETTYNSSYNFTLPIQSPFQREIYNYYHN